MAYTACSRLPLLATVFILALFVVAEAKPNFLNKAKAISRGNKLAKSLGIGTLVRLQREIANTRKCNVRLCFALDGSGSISPAEFKVQQDLVKLVASLASVGGATFSAVQYGLSNTAISGQTGNVAQFRKDVDASILQKATRTFVGAGLGFCISTLKLQGKGDGRTVVFLGDGRSNYFTLSLPLVLSDLKDIKIRAVGIGFPRNAKTLVEIAGNKSRVCQVNKYADVKGIVIKLVRSICVKKKGGKGGK